MRKVLYILGQLSDDDIEWMIANGVPQQLAPGAVLIREGELIAALYIVLDGVLAVVAASSGDAPIARLGAGEILGEISFVDTRPPVATVRAEQPALVLAIDRAQLRDRLEQEPWFAAHFYRAVSVFLADRLRNTVAQLGYGAPLQPSAAPVPESPLDEGVLDAVHLAGARFDRLLRHFVARESA